MALDDASKPLVIRYHLKAPRYAQITGRRILFQVNPFARSQAALFTASVRRNPIQFPYSWKESDKINIKLPEGFALDNADAPVGLNLGEAGKYNLVLQVTKSNELVVSRDFSFGPGGLVIFDAAQYPTLKKIFDEIARRDQHSLALKEK